MGSFSDIQIYAIKVSGTEQSSWTMNGDTTYLDDMTPRPGQLTLGLSGPAGHTQGGDSHILWMARCLWVADHGDAPANRTYNCILTVKTTASGAQNVSCTSTPPGPPNGIWIPGTGSATMPQARTSPLYPGPTPYVEFKYPTVVTLTAAQQSAFLAYASTLTQEFSCGAVT